MVVELAAVRVLAPRFGDAAPVWTNVIGVILLSLALGAAIGGWLADRGVVRVLLPTVLLLAGGLVFAGPFLAPRIGDWILPSDLPLDRALPVLIEGSFATALVCFGPPVLLLGAVAPMLITLASAHGGLVGRASGLVYAAGTIGSLVGTWLATLWLIPSLGISGTFAVAGAALLGAAALSAWLGGLGIRPLALLAAAPALSVLAPEPAPVWLGEARLLAREDSRYQRLWVVEDRERGSSIRLLKINEGLDSFHSVWVAGTPFTNGRYYDAFALLAEAFRGRRVDALSLGVAGGSIVRVLRARLGDRLRATGVDLDPAVIELGRRYFDLPVGASWLETVGDCDARVYLAALPRERRFDLICVDTYRHQIYLPPHLASVEFFELAQRHLAQDGLLALNVGDLSGNGPVLRAIAGTLAAVFETVEALRVPGSRNHLVVAYRGRPGRIAQALADAERPAGLSAKLWERGRRREAWRLFRRASADELLTDDRSVLTLLHERIYSRLPAR